MAKKAKSIVLADDLNYQSAGDKVRAASVRKAALQLAGRLELGISLVHVEDFDLFPLDRPFYEPHVDSYRKHMKTRLTKAAESFPVSIDYALLEGSVSGQLIELSQKRNKHEMIALGTHGRTGLKRALLGSVAEEVIRHSSMPVLTLGPKAQKAVQERKGSSGGLGKILVCTELGPNSQNAEDYAVKLADRLGAEIVLIHSVPQNYHPVLKTAFALPSARTELKEMIETAVSLAEEKLSVKRARLQAAGLKATYLIDSKSRTASEAILKAAKGADPLGSWIVMGTHGRNLLVQNFLGSTARETILGSHVPVITLHSRKG